MEKVRIREVENSIQPAAVMRELTGPLGSTDVAVNYFELEPGDSFSFAYHRHEIQEEIFYIQEGTATFQVESGSVTIGAGEVIRFGPGEFQRGWNRTDEPLTALAFGAPLEYGSVVRLRDCTVCGTMTDNDLDREPATGGFDDEEIVIATCKECGEQTGRWTRGSMEGTVP